MASTDPKVATQGQWEDLVSRVKSAGSSTIELTSTDPGEGSTLAEGKFIGVYGDAALVQTADIADGAVTAAKLAANSVSTTRIYDLNVTTAKIANGAVTAAKMDYSIMTVKGNSSSYASISDGDQVKLPTLQASDGSLLTQSDNGIKIGTGVTKVLVSASAMFNMRSNAYGWIELKKGTTSTGIGAITNVVTSSYGSATIPFQLLSVTAGNVIKIYSASNSYIRTDRCSLTVMVVA